MVNDARWGRRYARLCQVEQAGDMPGGAGGMPGGAGGMPGGAGGMPGGAGGMPGGAGGMPKVKCQEQEETDLSSAVSGAVKKVSEAAPKGFDF